MRGILAAVMSCNILHPMPCKIFMRLEKSLPLLVQKASFDDADSYINYLLTEGEFFMGKSQSDTSPY